jgi:hypothetical protein
MRKRAFISAVIAALLALGAAVSLHFAEQSGTEAVLMPIVNGPSLVHPTGLIIRPLPPAYTVHETETGFRIEPADALDLRNPLFIQLWLAEMEPLSVSHFKVKKVGDRDAHYRLDVDENMGSGGPLHTLTAWIACGSRRIVMTASQQAKSPERPDWSVAWAILAVSSCKM